jgi:branched-chain amino acid transport system permease protein
MGSGGHMTWLLGQALINGLLSGGVYALVAVGITIVFGVMKMINFAMGEFLMLGMYMTYIGYKISGANTYLLIPFVVVTMTVIALISFKLAIRPVLNKGNTAFILVTVGLSFLILNLAELIFGPDYLTVPSTIKSASLKIGNFTIGYPRLIALLVAFVMVVVVNIILNKTLLGRAMRATSEKPQVAQMVGINTERTYTIAFILGIVLAGVAGLLLTPLYYVNPQAGAIYKTTALIAVVLGGMGNMKGAFIGGLIIGLIEALVGTLIAPDLGPAGIFILFLVVLYYKPQGLFGKGERVG